MRVSILISTIAVGAICVAGAVGIVQAAPEFNRVFDSDSTPPLLAHNAATPASGNFGTAAKPARYAMKDVSEFTDAYHPRCSQLRHAAQWTQDWISGTFHPSRNTQFWRTMDVA